MARTKKGRPLSGVLILDKPQGMSSNRALQKVRHLFQAQKGGHTGSLDPLATGVLPICLGDATKFSAFLLDADKTYVATARLGEITATGDSEGAVLERRAVPSLSVTEFEAVLERFRGPIKQIPTMFSALKFEGRPLYEYARQGIEIERKARDITIKQLRLVELTADSFRILVHCTKGTYIRTLVEDIGLALGCGAHVTQLRRTAAGHFTLEQANTLDHWAQLAESSAQLQSADGLLSVDRLLPIDVLLPHFPELMVKSEDFVSIFNGQAVRIPAAESLSPVLGALVKIYGSEHELPGCIDAAAFSFEEGRFFLGLAEVVDVMEDVGFMLQPRRLIRFPETSETAQVEDDEDSPKLAEQADSEKKMHE